MSINITSTDVISPSLLVAYRPIPIRAVPTVPYTPVYFDVYFNGTFYKTLTQYFPVDIGAMAYVCDIQDACQEYLRSTLPTVKVPLTAHALIRDTTGIASVQVKVRGATYSGGFLVPDTVIPIQATVTTAAVSGSGLFANTFTVVNATLQHLDYQDYSTHLENWSMRSNGTYPSYTLSHRPKKSYIERSNLISANYESGWLPVYLAAGIFTELGGTDTSTTFKLILQGADGTRYTLFDNGDTIYDNSIYYVPFGMKQLSQFSPFSTIPISNLSKYTVIISAVVNDTLRHLSTYQDIYISPTILQQTQFPYGKRVWFLNRLGVYEQVSFGTYDETFTTTSSAKETPYISSAMSVAKSYRTKGRLNARSNETGEISGVFSEDEVEWLKELMESTQTFIEWKGTQGQNDDIVPINIADSEITSVQYEGKFQYNIKIKYTMANEHFIVRS